MSDERAGVGAGFAAGALAGFVVVLGAGVGIYVATRSQLRPWIAGAITNGLNGYYQRIRETRERNGSVSPEDAAIEIAISSPRLNAHVGGIVAEIIDRKAP